MGGFDRLQEFCGLQTFLSGAYVVAWSWVLVNFSFMHTFGGAMYHWWRGQSAGEHVGLQPPLWFHQWIIGEGDAILGPRSFWSFTLESIGVFALALILLKVCEGSKRMIPLSMSPWIVTLTAAIEFFPAPIFTELMMSYVGGRSVGSDFSRGLREIMVCWLFALLFHLVNLPKRFQGLAPILRKSTGFALAVAWMCWLRTFEFGVLAQTMCLVIMGIATARLSAPPLDKDDTCRRRHAELVALNMKVMCAVALRDWLAAVMGRSAFGMVCSLLFVTLFSAFLSAMVSRANLEDAEREIRAHETDIQPVILRLMAFVPCVWIWYPWLPLGLLAGRHSSKVKDRWGSQVAHSGAIAFSLVAINLLETTVFTLSDKFGWCSASTCPSPIKTILLEVILAVVTTIFFGFLALPFAPSLQEIEEAEHRSQVRLLDGY